MAYKLMYIPNDDTQNSSSIDYNYWLKCLDTHKKSPKMLSKRIRLSMLLN